MIKRILLFSCFYPPHLGGVERYSYNLSQRLADMDIEVMVITSHGKSKPKREKQGKVDVLYLPAHFVVGERLAIPRLGAGRMMRRAIGEFDADAALINTNLYFHSMMAAKYTKKQGIKSLAICHGTGHITADNSLVTAVLHRYEHFITNSMKKNITAFGGVSKACCNYLKHFDIDAKYVVYNAFELSDNEKTDIIKRLDINENTCVLSFAARMIAEKGIVDLLKAYKKALPDTNRQSLLVVAGDGPLYEPLMAEYTEDNIIFCGRLNHNEMIDVFKRSDIYISPTKYPEGLPTSILEAGLMKCAVIATPMGGTPEVIDKDTGIMVDCGDIDAMSDAIIKMINDTDYSQNCAENLYKLINEDFNWTNSAQKALDTLNKITKD